ncbi:MAG: hypothetical protein IVW53_14755 [Chloroflexi bacterium]|nr:hypothetical protein [Chloroflexota bacterium]
MPRTDKYPYRPDVHLKCIQAAIARKVITYGDLGTSRAMVGKYLSHITHEEDNASRPPVTAVVVRKSTRRPGPGFLEAMQEIKYAQPGESDSQVWKRALADVHQYWHPKLDDDRAQWPRFHK